MSPNHPDAVKSGHAQVTVPTMNLMKFLTENTIHGDFVILKMDIEGAEWDVLPCLANAVGPSMKVDRLFLEVHPNLWASNYAPTDALEEAKRRLRRLGVD